MADPHDPQTPATPDSPDGGNGERPGIDRDMTRPVCVGRRGDRLPVPVFDIHGHAPPNSTPVRY